MPSPKAYPRQPLRSIPYTRLKVFPHVLQPLLLSHSLLPLPLSPARTEPPSCRQYLPCCASFVTLPIFPLFGVAVRSCTSKRKEYFSPDKGRFETKCRSRDI